MMAYEEYCELEKPDAVIVVGDVNSTLACAIVAKKLCIPVAHVEAGLRSGDISMPEEVNRIVTDSISDWFFATEPSGVKNLRKEGKPRSAVHYVGHVMVDNLLYQVDKLPRSGGQTPDELVNLKRNLISQSKRYGVVTLHRPSNVDSAETLTGIVAALEQIADEVPLVFPVHPRTHANMLKFGIKLGPRISAIAPQGYMAFLSLWMDAAFVLTDSGGLQEETTALGVPCLTLRDNTERPVTVDEGTNILVGTNPERILAEAHKILQGQGKVGRRPRFWDGRAAERIVQILEKELS
jgi:UDP-N-acetylglucosamine 2-epimerase (non-hydrolysing)